MIHVLRTSTPMKSMFRPLLLALAVAATAGFAQANEAIIKKARAYVGSETALGNLNSVHYKGTLEVAGAAGSESSRVDLEIVFQRPYQQRIEARSSEKIEVTALDDYEAWQREQDPANEANWRMTLLGTDQIKRLRANTWENLSFYRGIESRGGEIQDLGSATVDGVETQKLAFVHDDNITFYRYFDKASGRLVLTETESGSSIREEGEIKSGGLRFPKKIITTNKLADDSTREISVTFETIEVNKQFPDSHFEVPVLGTR